MASVNLEKAPKTEQPNDTISTAFREIGQLLAEARIAQKLSIKQVASKIHIRQRYLIDLEEGYLSDLPGRVYILGFIRNYARLLQLDGEELIRRVSELPDLPKYEGDRGLIPERSEEEPSHLMLIVSFALILIVSIGGYFFLKPSSQEISSQATLPLETSSQETPSTLGVTPTEPAQPPVKESASVQEPVLAQDKEEKPKDFALNEAQESTLAVAPKIIYPKEMPTVGPAPQSPHMAANSQDLSHSAKKIILKASEPSWVEVRDQTGRIIFMRVMKSAEEYTVPDKPGITISTGNAAGITIHVGNTKLPSLGSRGEVKRGIRIETLK
jgi:cytoskeleton protein RodZ